MVLTLAWWQVSLPLAFPAASKVFLASFKQFADSIQLPALKFVHRFTSCLTRLLAHRLSCELAEACSLYSLLTQDIAPAPATTTVVVESKEQSAEAQALAKAEAESRAAKRATALAAHWALLNDSLLPLFDSLAKRAANAAPQDFAQTGERF